MLFPNSFRGSSLYLWQWIPWWHLNRWDLESRGSSKSIWNAMLWITFAILCESYWNITIFWQFIVNNVLFFSVRRYKSWICLKKRSHDSTINLKIWEHMLNNILWRLCYIVCCQCVGKDSKVPLRILKCVVEDSFSFKSVRKPQHQSVLLGNGLSYMKEFWPW